MKEKQKLKKIIVQSPGRINIIGEHTDYNDGYVLPAAIDKRIVMELKLNDTPTTVNLFAQNLDERFSFELNNFAPQKNGWPNYLMGVVAELQKLGAKLHGFDAQFAGNVPIGSGMSSSASLSCSLAFALNELFDLGFQKMQLIKVAQFAEHNFVGTKCGIMDQFASMMGKLEEVILLDCRSLDYQYFPLELGDYQILLLNTNVTHSLASSEYNKRQATCNEGVAILQKYLPSIQKLRDVQAATLKQFEAQLPNHIYKRCQHVVTENKRTLAAAKAIHEKDHQLLGQLMYNSHFSLQNDYEVSCPELDFLVQQTIDQDFVLGSRMMGGGFGGCTINIIAKEKADEFVNRISTNYRKQFAQDLTPYLVNIAAGSRIVSADWEG